MEINKIHLGDARTLVHQLEDKSVHCIVTSPPYFGLRDYGVADQMGLEKTPEDFVKGMVDLFRVARQKLRDDGTLWLNIGDSYAGYWGDQKAKDEGRPSLADGHGFSMNSRPNFRELNNVRSSTLEGGKTSQNKAKRSHEMVTTPNYKPKDLLGIPWMLAFALRADGWYLRQDIIWHKPNPMPESVTDRCTKAHEYIFLLSKSSRYYYDQAAVMQEIAHESVLRLRQENLENQEGSDRAHDGGKVNGKMKAVHNKKFPAGWDGSKGSHRSKSGRYTSGNKERKPGSARGCPEGTGSNVAASVPWEGMKANKRSVWTVTTKPFKAAHFATFPEELIVDCIKAGCPEGGIVLDPFAGAGTTPLVARKLYRNFIGFELNADYIKIAERRLKHDLGLFL